MNHANLRLLLATLTLYDALPEGLEIPVDREARSRREGPGDPMVGARTTWIAWEDPHALDPTGGRHAARDRTTTALWREAVARWLRLVRAPAFLASVHDRIARLGDDVVGDDDAEAIVNAATTRIMDLVVGEVKAQLLAGRMDRVGALMEAAGSSEFDPRRWTMAFRQLRPLFRTAAAELEPLLPQGEEPRHRRHRLYLSRLRALLDRWRSLDPTGLLGLAEIGDEAVSRACASLSNMENFQAVDRLKALYSEAMALASADSLKQRIATTVGRIDGLENYACHFCRSREMDPNRSIVITGKKESHRTYGFNSTTIHYMLKADLIPRCPRCSELHQSFWDNSGTLRGALWVAAAGSVAFMYWIARRSAGREPEPIAYALRRRDRGRGRSGSSASRSAGSPRGWPLPAASGGTGRRPRPRRRIARHEVRKEADRTIDYRRDAFDRFNRTRQLQG